MSFPTTAPQFKNYLSILPEKSAYVETPTLT
jgi:hypothetical protein